MLEQGRKQGLLGDLFATSAASDDLIHLISLGKYLQFLSQAEPVVETADNRFVHLHHHEVWATEDGTSCVALTTGTYELVESDEGAEPSEPPPLVPCGGALTSEALTSESPREPNDSSHLRESPRAEGVRLVAQGPQASLQISTPVNP